MSYAVVNDSFGPTTVTAEDGFGNALPAGDIPLCVSSRRLKGAAGAERCYRCDSKPSAAGTRARQLFSTRTCHRASLYALAGELEISKFVRGQ